jgi:hypothetical protein
MDVQIGTCAGCNRKLLVFLGRCHECRRAFVHKALASKPADAVEIQSSPPVERFERCVLEIDRALGKIFVHLPTGKTKVRVSRIPLASLTSEVIEVLSTTALKLRKRSPRQD